MPKLMIPLEVVPFGKIVINPSDLKHAVELLGYSGGLGVVITTRTHLWGAFYRRLPIGSFRLTWTKYGSPGRFPWRSIS